MINFWNQKQKIGLKPFGDRDRDGVLNIFDCSPYNKRKQGWAHQGVQFPRERSTHIKMMKPEKFLRTTYREVARREKVNLNKQGTQPLQNQIHEMSLSSLERYKREFATALNYDAKSRITRHNPQNIERLKKVIRNRKGKMDIPFLEYDEKGYPVGHEGRHRAIAAQELGIKLMPVTIARRLKQPRDWKKTREEYYKKTKKDWRNDLENVDEVTSSKSADIPIQQQREYGKAQSEALEHFPEKEYKEAKFEEKENGK